MTIDDGWLDDVFLVPLEVRVTPAPVMMVACPGEVPAELSGSATRRMLDEGAVLFYQGRHEEALPKLLRAKSMARTNYGPKSPAVAWILNYVGLALDGMKRHPEAEVALREALAIREATLDVGDPSIAVSLNNLGNNLGLQGRAEEGVPLFARAVQIESKKYGHDSPHTMLTRVHLVYGLADAGRNDEAIRELEQVRTGLERHGHDLSGFGDIPLLAHDLSERLGV